MKEYISYIYNLKNISIKKNKNEIKIEHQNKKYKLIQIYDEIKINEINNLLNNKTEYYKIIKNINNEIISMYCGNKYVLIEENTNYIINSKKIKITEIMAKNLSINQSNWSIIWSKQIDYYDNIISNNKLLIESKDYYIGLAEIALEYTKINNIKNDIVTICNENHQDKYNPLYIVLDCEEREIAEKIKYHFFYDEIEKINIDLLLKNKNIKKIIARLLYPNYYFELYNRNDIENIKRIINKNKVYEDFILSIIKKYD